MSLTSSRTNGTQKILFIEIQHFTIPVPGTKIIEPALVAGFTIIGSIPVSYLFQSDHFFPPMLCSMHEYIRG
jgi:hypothetical protein